MNFEIHTLYYKNSDPIFFEFHLKIMKKFNIPIQYTNETINVGSWMNKVMKNSKSDIVGFIDIDCVVTNKDIIKKCLSYVQKKKEHDWNCISSKSYLTLYTYLCRANLLLH